MNNYRLEIRDDKLNVDYWKEFHTLASWNSLLVNVKNQCEYLGAEQFWWFYEPYIEITFICENPSVATSIKKNIIENLKIDFPNAECKYLTPDDGDFADWYCESNEEMKFGAQRHHLSSEFVKEYTLRKKSIDDGKGLSNQIGRTIHTICNPLGLNYKEEAKICFKRGLRCLYFCNEWLKLALDKFPKIRKKLTGY